MHAAEKRNWTTSEVWPVTLRNYSFSPGTGGSTIHIKADNAAVIEPAVLKVTEDGQVRLPGVEGQAGAAWLHQRHYWANLGSRQSHSCERTLYFQQSARQSTMEV